MNLTEELIKSSCPIKIGDTVYLRKNVKTIGGIVTAGTKCKVVHICLRLKYAGIFNVVNEDNLHKWYATPECFIFIVKGVGTGFDSNFEVLGSDLAANKYGESFILERMKKTDCTLLEISALYTFIASELLFVYGKSASKALKCGTALGVIATIMLTRDLYKDISPRFRMLID